MFVSLTKSMSTSLPSRFTWIDETNRSSHYFLRDDDRCIYFGEYFGGQGYSGGPTNQLIFNFKAKPSVIANNAYRKRYKGRATELIARGLRRAIKQSDIESLTWVPIPPSKAEGHADYDPRLPQTLAAAFDGFDADIRPILRQTESVEADHDPNHDRISPERLSEIIEVDEALLNSMDVRSNGIVLFDDVLTTGKHFRCCTDKIKHYLPDVRIIGIFVARCIHADPFADFENVDEV